MLAWRVSPDPRVSARRQELYYAYGSLYVASSCITTFSRAFTSTDKRGISTRFIKREFSLQYEFHNIDSLLDIWLFPDICIAIRALLTTKDYTATQDHGPA